MAEKTLLEEIQEEYNDPRPQTTTKTTRRKNNTIKKLIMLLILLFVVATEIFVLLWCGWVWSQYNELKAQSPINIQAPLTWWEKGINNDIGKRASQLDPKTKIELVYGGGYGDIVWKIHTLETQNGNAENGHHKDCEQLGKTNEFGYFKGGNRNFCFNSFEESVTEVSQWFKSNLEEMPLSVAICYYNTGQITSDCSYLQHYRSL